MSRDPLSQVEWTKESALRHRLRLTRDLLHQVIAVYVLSRTDGTVPAWILERWGAIEAPYHEGGSGQDV